MQERNKRSIANDCERKRLLKRDDDLETERETGIRDGQRVAAAKELAQRLF